MKDIYEELDKAGLYKSQVETIRSGPYTEKYLRTKLQEYLWEEKNGRRPVHPGWLFKAILDDAAPSREYQRDFAKKRAARAGEELDEAGRPIKTWRGYDDARFLSMSDNARASLVSAAVSRLAAVGIPHDQATPRMLYREIGMEFSGGKIGSQAKNLLLQIVSDLYGYDPGEMMKEEVPF